MSSRLQTAWTFSRVFLHNGACPAAVDIIACDYLPLMSHTTLELRLTGSLKCSLRTAAKPSSFVRVAIYECMCWLRDKRKFSTKGWLWVECFTVRVHCLDLPSTPDISNTLGNSLSFTIQCSCNYSNQPLSEKLLHSHFHSRFLRHARVLGDNGCAMVTARPSASVCIIPSIPHFHAPEWSECSSPQPYPPQREVLASFPGN